MTEQVAIIREVEFGNRDVGRPVLSFTVYMDESTAALQVFGIEQAEKIVRESGVRNINDLNGKPCWVDVTQDHVRFLRVWKR